MSVNRWYSVAFALFAIVALLAARNSGVPTWVLATLIGLGWAGWFIKIGQDESKTARQARERALVMWCRTDWRATQGADAAAMSDFLLPAD